MDANNTNYSTETRLDVRSDALLLAVKSFRTTFESSERILVRARAFERYLLSEEE